LARLSAAASSVGDGEPSPWRSFPRPRRSEGSAFVAGGGGKLPLSGEPYLVGVGIPCDLRSLVALATVAVMQQRKEVVLPAFRRRLDEADLGHVIGVDGKKLAVVGNSVGGNMAAVVALMAKDRRGPEIKLQVLLWPVTNANFETVSYHDFASDRFLTRNMMVWFWDNYTSNPDERGQIYASPLLATTEQLQHLPPTLVQTAENDVLRDEGEAYARKLDEAGVPVTLTRYEGLIHDYGLLNPLAHVPAVKTAVLQAAVVIREALK